MSDRFDEVVANAFDFLHKSINELPSHPKYSVIHFYSAIELIVKARLLKEHWSLIVAKPENADRARFLSGDFQSIGLNEASDRLAKIADDGLSGDEIKCFDGLRRERNQMVHFAHTAQRNNEAASLEMQRVIAEHAKGWLHLRRLLAGRWNSHFAAHTGQINSLDQEMKQQTKSLEPKFILLTDDLEHATSQGEHFVSCPSCNFKSFEGQHPASIGEGNCWTCGLSASFLSVACSSPNCTVDLTLLGSYDSCTICGHSYTPEEVRSALSSAALLAQRSPFEVDEPVSASCGDCGDFETVIELKNGSWFCSNCFEFSEHVGQCEWCTGYSTRVPEHSYLVGCSQCEGRAGHEKDD